MAAQVTRSGALKTCALGVLLLGGFLLNVALRAGEAAPAAAPAGASADGIALAPASAAAVGTPSAPAAWGGERRGGEATLSDRVVDYDIAATLDPLKHTIDGKQKLAWRNRSTLEVKSVYLHLYMNAFESAASTYHTESRAQGLGGLPGDGEWGHIALRGVTQNGAKVPWTFVHPDGGPARDHTVVRFDLPAPVAAGATTVLNIDFHTQLPRVINRTGYFGSFHLAGQWFPKIGVLELPGERGATSVRWNVHEFHPESEFYADFGNFDVRLTVPAGYTVGATGERQGEPQAHGGMLTHHFVQSDVHDFAFTADNRSAPPMRDSWRGPGSPTVNISVIYPPEYAASAAPALKAAKDSLDYFSRTLGPYPYRNLTIVIPPYNAEQAGGMEYPTFFTVAGYRSIAPRTMDAYDLDFVTVHEFGHGYFYGILASNEFEEPALDEGLNEFWDQRMLQARGQKIHPAPGWLRAVGVNPGFDVFDFERFVAPRKEPADAPGQNAYRRIQGIGPAYVRTAVTLRDLERRIGSAAMERGFKEYYRRWKFRHPGMADLREALAEASGQRAAVEAVFARQMIAVAKVDDRLDALSSGEQLPQPGTAQRDGAWVEETADAVEQRVAALRAQWRKTHPDAAPGSGPFPWQTRVTVRRRGTAVPQTIVVRFADGRSETARWDADERWHTFTWLTPARAVSAELDPQRAHHLDVSKLDDSRTVEPDGAASRRWSADFAALAQTLLSLIATL